MAKLKTWDKNLHREGPEVEIDATKVSSVEQYQCRQANGSYKPGCTVQLRGENGEPGPRYRSGEDFMAVCRRLGVPAHGELKPGASRGGQAAPAASTAT